MSDYKLSSDQAKELLWQMILSRETDRRSGVFIRQGKAIFTVASSGHEATGAIACHLEPDDYLFPYYRDRTLLQIRGVDLVDLTRDFLIKEKGRSRGRSMAGHWSYSEKNIVSHASPTGSQCLPAAGIAWKMKLKGEKNVVTCSIGEASTRQGEFYEAVCFAVEKKLPIVFVVHDNKYGISTPTKNMLAFRLGIFDKKLVDRVDASDVYAVYEQSGRAIEKARRCAGPTILWCELDRLDNHTSNDDQRIYREEAELSFDERSD